MQIVTELHCLGDGGMGGQVDTCSQGPLAFSVLHLNIWEASKHVGRHAQDSTWLASSFKATLLTLAIPGHS